MLCVLEIFNAYNGFYAFLKDSIVEGCAFIEHKVSISLHDKPVLTMPKHTAQSANNQSVCAHCRSSQLLPEDLNFTIDVKLSLLPQDKLLYPSKCIMTLRQIHGSKSAIPMMSFLKKSAALMMILPEELYHTHEEFTRDPLVRKY